MSEDSEGYPSWLPGRPLPPAPASTALHSPPESPASDGPPLFAGSRKPTPRSMRVVSVHDPRRAPARAANPRPLAPPGTSRASQPRFHSRTANLDLLRNPSAWFRLYFYVYPLLVFAHIPLQTFFDFNAVYILIQVSKFPSAVPGSGRNWALGAAAYIASWLTWILVVVVVYELIYSFARRWRVKRPLILPIYLSAPAFNLVAMTSYSNFCFLHHIRFSSPRPALAESFWFYSQNLPTVALLLPRAGLALALLLSFSAPVHPSASIPLRDATFFRPSDGTLTPYARGVLIANAAWTAWRVLVLLVSWIGLWVVSGQACAGLCGPRYRWEEDDAEKTRRSFCSDDEDDDADGVTLGWSWRQRTRARIVDAYTFCLTVRPPSAPPVQDVPVPKPALAKDRLQYPFTSAAACASSEDKVAITPELVQSGVGHTGNGTRESASEGSPEGEEEEDEEDEEEDEEEEEEEEEEEDEEDEEESEDPSTGRGSESMSSLGQPVVSRYPFQYRRPARGTSASSGPVSQHTPATSQYHSRSTRSGASSRGTQSTQYRESSDSSPRSQDSAVSSNSNGHSGIPMPPRHPRQQRGRRRAGTSPPTTAVPPPPPPPIVFPTSRPTVLHTRADSDGAPSLSSSTDAAECEDLVGLLSSPRARSSSSFAASIRARAQSLMQSISAASHSSRAQSSVSVVRPEEDVSCCHSDGHSGSGSGSASGSGSVNENYTFGQRMRMHAIPVRAEQEVGAASPEPDPDSEYVPAPAPLRRALSDFDLRCERHDEPPVRARGLSAPETAAGVLGPAAIPR